MLQYSLEDNPLTERPDDYSAIAHAAGSYMLEDIINAMLSRGTLVTRTDIMAVLNNFFETTESIIERDGMVNTPLFNTSFSISGVFNGPLDSFDSGRHKLNINISRGIRLRDTEKRVKLEKTNPSVTLPQIQEVKDTASNTVNERLTPNGVIEVRGYTLKIEGEHPNCGLWFVHENGTETKASQIFENKPSKILSMIPALPQGNYQLKIVTQYSIGGKILKTPKVYIPSKVLKV